MSMHRAIVVHCHHAQAVLPETGRRLKMLLDRAAAAGLVTEASAVRLVDDDNFDSTWPLVQPMCGQDGRGHAIERARDHGHRAARMVGLQSAPGDALVRIDADLRDDVVYRLRLS